MSETKPKLAETIQNLTPKHKQYLLLAAIGSVFFGLIIGSVKLWGPEPIAIQKSKSAVQTKDIVTPGAQVDPKDVWMAESSKDIKGVSDAVTALQQQMDAMKKDNADHAKESPPQALPPISTAPVKLQPAPATQIPPPVAASTPLPAPVQPEPPKEPEIAVFEVGDAAAPQPVDEIAEKDIYLPSGSFMRAVLLGGLDAATGGQAQNNPWPVLMRIQNNAFLPNRYRAKVKECFALGSGYGDLSSERAFLRLESLSCVLNDGQVIDANAKGYVVGEDGKAGMRGRLVSKQGQVLANALLTGLVSGIGQGISTASTTSSMSALGGINTVNPGQQIAAGVGVGVGTSLGKLSQYYITMADKIFPILEVDAGRVVDIVLTKGLKLGIQSGGAPEDNYTEIWKRGRALQNKPLDVMEGN